MNSIERRIISEFENGIDIDDKIFSFASDLGFEISFKGMCEIMEDEDHEIHDELTSLIFSPDHGARMKFVFLWKDINSLKIFIDYEFLYEEVQSIFLNYGKERFSVLISKAHLKNYLSKLGLEKRLNNKVINTVAEFDEKDQPFLLSSLWSKINGNLDGKTDLLVSYLNKSSLPGFFLRDEFLFFINILFSWDIEKSGFDIYIARLVHFYQKAYRSAVETENFLKANNVETLMVQGGRILASNPAKLSIQKHYLFGIANKLGLSREIFTEDGFDLVF